MYIGDVCGETYGEFSNCRKIDDCPVVKEDITMLKDIQRCEFNGPNETNPLICCPQTNNKHTVNPTTNTTPKPITNRVARTTFTIFKPTVNPDVRNPAIKSMYIL